MTDKELFFRHLGLPSLNPMGLEIAKAEGIWLYDTSGKKYIDLVAGISVSNTGHRHPRITRAITEQMDQYLHANVYGEFILSPQVKLATKLASLLPGNLSSVYLVNSGSEAVEGAIKLAKRATGRTEVISFGDAYHGSTMGALSILGNESLKNAFRPLIPDTRIIGFNNFTDLEKITEKTACVIVETIQAEAGMILPEKDFLSRLRNRCQETGALLIADDVQMGFGRTGKMFSFEHFDFVPDILVLAKAMGGEMPIGAFISSKKIMETLANQPELGHITTFGGHPVCCAAALANLEILTEGNLINEVNEKGKRIFTALASHRLIKEIRWKGMAMGVELKDAEMRARVAESMLANGIIIDWFLFSPGTFRIAPPLTITQEEIGLSCKLVLKALNEV